MNRKPKKQLSPSQLKQPEEPKLLQVMGPGLITGAADDDPSGIATYSQVGAQFGYGIGWALLFSYPLMCAIQQISAEIGRVTGLGLAGNLLKHYPQWLLYLLIALLMVANIINIGADLGAMGAAVKLLIGGPTFPYICLFAAVSVTLEIFVRYSRYVSILKWLTLSLFAYVATVFVVDVNWREVAGSIFWPHMEWNGAYITAIVAVLGTTISPYLFFWQANSEVEAEREGRKAKPLLQAPEQAHYELKRIQLDTYAGMALSNVVALFIVITAAATLHAHGLKDIQTSAQAAEALRPIAGRFAYIIFALGIIGTGMLALPVLAGSGAFALGEARGWPVGFAHKANRAKAFYFTIAAATFVGVALNLTPIDPVKALFWSAVINGVAAVPIMAMIVVMASQHKVMGKFKIKPLLKIFGWLATLVMAAAAVAMFLTWGAGG